MAMMVTASPGLKNDDRVVRGRTVSLAEFAVRRLGAFALAGASGWFGQTESRGERSLESNRFTPKENRGILLDHV